MSDPGSRYRRVYALEWQDPIFRQLDDYARVVRLYVSAGPQTTSVGCFRLSTALAVEDLGRTPERFEELLQTVSGAYGWPWDPVSRVIWIRDWFDFNPPASPNVVTSWAKLLKNVPPSWVRDEAVASITQSLKSLPAPFREPWTELTKSFRRPEVRPETNQGSGISGSGIQGNREQAALRAEAVKKRKTTNLPTPDPRMLKIARDALNFGDPTGPIDRLIDTFDSCRQASGVSDDIKRSDVVALLNIAIAEQRGKATA